MPTRIPVLGPQVPLRELRKALGLTLSQLAAQIRDCGYHRAPTEGTLANVELGRQAGSRKLMTAWAIALRLPPQAILQDDELRHILAARPLLRPVRDESDAA